MTGVQTCALPISMGFMSLVEGVKLSMLSSPTDMSPEAAESVLTLFVDSIMKLARIEGEGRTSKD